MQKSTTAQMLLTLAASGLARGAAVATTTSSIPSSSLCPSANGVDVSYEGSSAYNVTCSSDSSQISYTEVDAANSYLDCMTACDAASSTGCEGFVYVGASGGDGSGYCYLKTAMGSYTATGANYIAGYKGTATTAAPTPTATITCPASDKSTYTALNGDLFMVQCGLDHAGGDMSSVSVPTLAECAEACADTDGCIYAAYSGVACYMKNSIGQAVEDGVWGLAKLTGSADISCPASNETTYTSNNGQQFVVECGIDHAGGDMASYQVPTFGECVELCADTTGCVDLAYSGVGCYLKSSIGETVYDGSWGARLL